MRLRAFKVILALSLALVVSPVFARDSNICLADAQAIHYWAMLREGGLEKERLVQSIDWTQLSENVRNSLKNEVLQEIDIIWKSKKSAQEVTEDYFTRCLKFPAYIKETQT